MFEIMNLGFIKDHFAYVKKIYVDMPVVKTACDELKVEMKGRVKVDKKIYKNSDLDWANLSKERLIQLSRDKENDRR